MPQRPTEPTPHLDSLAELSARRKRVIGRLFLRAATAFQRIATERIHADGFEDYRQGDNAVMVHLDADGVGISELARRAGMSRQGMAKAVRDLDERGLVRREPDPDDARAQLVFFTERGAERLVDAVHVVEALDAEWAAIVGAERLEVIRQALLGLLEEVDPRGF